MAHEKRFKVMSTAVRMAYTPLDGEPVIDSDLRAAGMPFEFNGDGATAGGILVPLDGHLIDNGTIDLDTATQLPAADKGHRYRLTGTTIIATLGLGRIVVNNDIVECLVDGTVANAPANWHVISPGSFTSAPRVDGVLANPLRVLLGNSRQPAYSSLVIDNVTGTTIDVAVTELHMIDVANSTSSAAHRGIRALTLATQTFTLPVAPVANTRYLLSLYTLAGGTFGLYVREVGTAFVLPAGAQFLAAIGQLARGPTTWTRMNQRSRTVTYQFPITVINNGSSTTETASSLLPYVDAGAATVDLDVQYSCDANTTRNGYELRTLTSQPATYNNMTGKGSATYFRRNVTVPVQSNDLLWRTYGRANEALIIDILGYQY